MSEKSLESDPITRIAEIRQENRGGDVSHEDIAWLCRVADAAVTYLAYGDPGSGYDARVGGHLRRALRKVVYGR